MNGVVEAVADLPPTPFIEVCYQIIEYVDKLSGPRALCAAQP